jgi:hypothetical protein
MIHAVAQEVITLKDVEISPGSGVKHQSLSSSGITHQFPLSSIKHQSASSSGIQEAVLIIICVFSWHGCEVYYEGKKKQSHTLSVRNCGNM